MKNYENKLKAIKKIADEKNAQVVFLDYKDGKHSMDGKQVEINTIKANAIIIDDISDTPTESLEKGSDMDNEDNG